jgi:transketolase
MNVGDLYAPRRAMGEALVELGENEPRLVVLDADVGTSTQTALFRDRFPDRFYQIGIAEQNMIGIAAGMASVGLIPFVSTFAVFTSRRALDQVAISVAYPRLNVKINGGYGGAPTGKAGATHQAFEDLAIMRAVPNMVVLSPADSVETRQAVAATVAHDGPVYLRTIRCDVPTLFDDTHDFVPGRAYRLREGGDLAIFAHGITTAKALAAAEILSADGIAARVVHMPTLKPIDADEVVAASRDLGRIITVEDHSIIGGLGSAVAEVLSEQAPCLLRRLGVPDCFGESGDNEAFYSKYGINTENIVAAAREFPHRKVTSS